MGWPFGPKKQVEDPYAVRPAQSHVWDKPLDFLQLAFNEGGRQLSETLGADDTARAFRDANERVTLDRLRRSGMPLADLARMDPGDFATREASFRKGSPFNPQSGGVQGWRAAQQQQVDDWNARVAQEGLAALEAPDAPILPAQEPQVADAGKRQGLMFGRRR